MSEPTGRLKSLDALRGFDMLFIMGGEGLICAIAALCGNPNFGPLIDHVPWDGLHFMDTVFPLFLFMAGVTFPFSLAKSRARGLTTSQIAWKCVRRGLILALLGLMRDGPLFRLDFAHIRVCSVLARIGLAWMFAALIYLAFNWKKRVGIAAFILALCTAIPYFFLAPDAAPGVSPFSVEGNWGCWLDRTLFPGHIYRPLYDPEGFASLLPAIVTPMLGMFAGEIVHRTPSRKTVLSLLACGLGSAVLGGLLSFICPINKALWSPSFVLVIGGYSFLMLALFHYLVDVKGITRPFFPFAVIGMNSITIYLAQVIIDFGHINRYFLSGFAGLFSPQVAAVILSCGYIFFCWLFLYILYRQKIFLKV